MRFTKVRAAGAVLTLLVGGVIVALQSPAEAAVTTSTITKPVDGARYMIKDSAPSTDVTVQGTTNGTTGDFVDIRCYIVGSHTWQSVKSDVAVQANGSFSTTLHTSQPYGSCRLRAVPQDHPKGASIAGFAGPRVTSEWVQSEKVTSGPNIGKTYDYYVLFQGSRVMNDLGSASKAGLWDSRLTYADGSSSNYLWYGNAGLNGDNGTRNMLRVDSRNAYGPYSARVAFQNNPGLPGLSWSAVRNTSTGVVTIKESNPIVFCPAGAPLHPSAEQCNKFISAGVRLDRTFIIKDGGLQVHVTDTWRSTDGKDHYVSPYYFQYVEGSDAVTGDSTPVGLKLPWSGKFQTYAGDKTFAGPNALPASLFVRDSNNAADGNKLLPRGAITFDFPLTVLRDDNDHFVLQAKTFKVPGGGSKVTRQSFVMGTSDAGVAAKAAANEERLD